MAVFSLRAAAIVVALAVLQGQFFPTSGVYQGGGLLAAVAVVLAGYCFTRLRPHMAAWVNGPAPSLTAMVGGMTPPQLRLAVMVTAGLTLLLELALIRWQAALFPVFALYKNFILLACFCGIGLGYAMARRGLVLAAGLPVMAMTVLLMAVLAEGADDALMRMLQAPRIETGVLRVVRTEGGGLATEIGFYLPTLVLLAGAFVLNVLVCMPLAQLCGALMERFEKPLAAYGCNLLGSLAGVLAMFAFSAMWSGPVLWFTVCAAGTLWFAMASGIGRRAGLVWAAVMIAALAWPGNPAVQTIYSPYQHIEKMAQEKTGLSWLLASGSYHQHITDLSEAGGNREKYNTGFFEIAYLHAKPLDEVLIIGSGVGNDTAAALRAGARHVDAVEIDPAIIAVGKADHPERPYQDPRVTVTADDGRGFVRRGVRDKYDLVTYGMQDTTIVMSYGTGVRFDTYLFTREGLREAYDSLKSGGVMSVSFMLPPGSHIAPRIYTILKQLPDAGAPMVVEMPDDQDTVAYLHFMVRKGGAAVDVPDSFLRRFNLKDVSADYAGMTAAENLPTDDWPFFLMEAPAYPVNYIVSLGLVLLLSFMLVRQVLPGQGVQAGMLPFFFMGAGFMLVETKAISELSLAFGNTWQVVAVTVVCVLLMAYAANIVAARCASGRLLWPAFAGIVLAVAAGYFTVTHDVIDPRAPLGGVAMAALLTCPLFFSGIAFSTLFSRTKDVGGAMAYNIMGAMLGGLLEYNAMRLGFSALYPIGAAVYVLAAVTAARRAA
jgi:SAM-dependent methyltransferase